MPEPSGIAGEKGLSSALSCGLFLRIIQAISPPVRIAASVEHDLGEDLLPEFGHIVVDDGRLDQTGVHHFQEVLDFEVFRREPQS